MLHDVAHALLPPQSPKHTRIHTLPFYLVLSYQHPCGLPLPSRSLPSLFPQAFSCTFQKRSISSLSPSTMMSVVWSSVAVTILTRNWGGGGRIGEGAGERGEATARKQAAARTCNTHNLARVVQEKPQLLL